MKLTKEQIAAEELKAENLELRETVKRCTVELEYKNRELEIEASLESIRSHAMAMRDSGDLSVAAGLVFSELKKLGIHPFRSGVGLLTEEPCKALLYAAMEGPDYDALVLVGTIDMSAHKCLALQYESCLKQENYFPILKGKEFQSYFAAIAGQIPIPSLAESQFRKTYYGYYFPFKEGYFYTWTETPYTTTEISLLERFKAIIALTFRRYLDLQKAEAQTREAQIELGLERVRARAMAMQSSSELSELVDTVFKELTKLDFALTWCIINIIDESSLTNTVWAASPDIDKAPESYYMKFEDYPFHHAMMKGWKERNAKYVYVLEGLEKKVYDEYLFNETEFRKVPEAAQAASRAIEKYVCSFSFSNFGGLQTVGDEPLSEANLDIISRFGKVFDLTYTRFNDLKLAEAQAREAQIQLAMERVRARTMAMQRSEDLLEAASLLFDQIEDLGTKSWSSGFIIFQPEDLTINSWMSKPDGSIGIPFNIPLTEDSFFIKIYEAMQRGEDFYVMESGDKELAETYRYMFSLPGAGKALGSFESLGFKMPTFQITHCAFFSHGFLMFITYEPVPELWNIFKRFGKVFEQTYTRFLDLQKAEEQAREAQIEASLERIRSRAMAIRKSDELGEVIQIIFHELNKLGIDLMECSIATYDDTNPKDLIFWSAGPFGSAQSSCTKLQYIDHPLLIELLNDFKSGTQYRSGEFSGELLETWWDRIFVETDFKYAPKDFIESWKKIKQVFYSQAAMNHGFLEFLGEAPLPDDKVQILKRFTNVIDLTYTRYDDVVKAEAQAREAQIEASLERVRSKAMGMHSSKDLADTIVAFYHELEIFSITPRRCGVGLLNKGTRIAELSTINTTELGKSIEIIGTVKMTGHPILDGVYENWLLQKEYHPVLRGPEIPAYYQLIRPQIAFPDYPNDVVQYGYFFYFPEGGVYAWTDKEMAEEELKIYRRFTSVLSLTYKRYKDLQQAEELAKQAEEDLVKLKEEKKRTEDALTDLKSAQFQLIQSEKMASLGELTAGIAHEIQNPLNFVNNFSEVNVELIDELREELTAGNLEQAIDLSNSLKENEEKIIHHGKRADAIVKSMLQHSRTSSGKKELTDINELADEYLRLAYHGLRAKDKSFNAKIETEYDPGIGKINIIPQDVGRAVLNLITNAFYAVADRKNQNEKGYEPIVRVSIIKSEGMIELRVVDNGKGIPEQVLDKIFQPFFTTKPTGQGTGLGLSLSYDIVKAHGGELKVETKEREGTTFIISIPVN